MTAPMLPMLPTRPDVEGEAAEGRVGDLHGRFYRLRAVFPASLALSLAVSGYDVIGWARVEDTL